MTGTYETYETAWCPGCGDFGILSSVKMALEALGKAPHEVLMIGGIGQAAKLPQYISANGLCSLHGRALPGAIGAKLANTDLTIIVNSGDGDCFGEGGNHFLHAVRRDLDLTLMVHNNQIYGLTKGQGSPTSDVGLVTGTQPRGVVTQPLRGPALALTLGCRFVARGFSGDAKGLSELLQQAVNHRGFSFIEVLQPCISMNKTNTFAWYKNRIKDVEDVDPNYDPTNRKAAMEKAETWGDVIPAGILYQAPGNPYEDSIPMLAKGPLVKQPPRTAATIEALFDGFK
jgi:2-oxoglutarate ferredoxin oxidoreductase subunit beta